MNNKEFFGQVVTSLIDILRERKISFCILRNYQLLPDENIGSDIDILIDQEGYEKFNNILSEINNRHGIQIFQKVNNGSTGTFYRLYKHLNNYNTFFLQIDIRRSLDYYGAVYLTAEQILTTRRVFKTFFIPNPVHEALIVWLSPFLYGGSIKDRYKNVVKNTANTNQENFLNELSSITSKKLANKIFPFILKGDWKHLEKYRFSIRLMVLFLSILRKPISFLINFVTLLFISVKYRLSPPGIQVALLGPDGSGKTTIAEKVFEILKKPYYSDKKCIIHWRPGLLPQLNELYYKIFQKNEKRQNFQFTQNAKPSNFILSLLKLIYYTLDFILGYFLIVKPKLYRGMLVIFDRYYYNFIVDPLRSRINLPAFIIKLFMRFILKPDVVICLDNKPEIIFGRKQELTINEIDRQIKAYRELTTNLGNGYIINGNRPIDEIVSEVINIILNVTLGKIK